MANGLDTPRHTQADILPLVGVPASTLQNWANRGVIALSEQNPGKAKRRLYSELDVIKLVTMVELTRFGIGPAVAADMAGARRVGLAGKRCAFCRSASPGGRDDCVPAVGNPSGFGG